MKTRRSFIKGLALGSAAAIAYKPSIAIAAKKKFRWKMATTWPPKLPILQEAPELFAKMVKTASQGRLNIKVFAAGELIPGLGVFDAVSQGSIQMGVGAPYYWAGKSKAAQYFCSMPFGMNAQQFNAWMIGGEGQKLWEETYAKFNLVPFQFGNTGAQTGGWFKKELKNASGLKGLKMRIPGFGGAVMAKAGANVVLLSGAEIYTALERGTVDAAEWVSPFHDERMGLYRAAKFYYYPGWQEPQANLELTVNKKDWDELPKDLQAIVSAAAAKVNLWTLSSLDAKNGPALKRLKEKHKVKIMSYPKDVLDVLRKSTEEVMQDLAQTNAETKKISQSIAKFRKEIDPWYQIGERGLG